MGERQDANNAGGVPERVTIAEAAALLGCHPNTVRNRVRAGMYRAEKVVTERGPTWMIDRDSLTTNTPSSVPQQAVSGVPAVNQEALQLLAREIVREAGIARDPEREAEQEGNKLQLEATRTQVIVSSGLLAGMAAVTTVLPDVSLVSPLIYLAFAMVLISIYMGILMMHAIAESTAQSERFGGARWLSDPTLYLIGGLFSFLLFVLWNNPTNTIRGPTTQLNQMLLLLAAIAVAGYAGTRMRMRRERRRSVEPSGTDEQPPRRAWWRRWFGA